MREKYETVFGIRNHDAPDVHPLALMTMTDVENSTKGCTFEKRLKDYMAFDILKHTGLSIKDLMAYPRDRVESIIAECKRKQARLDKEAQDIQNNLGNS